MLRMILIALLSLSLAALAGADKTEKLNLSASGINKLEVDCGSGFLRIAGKAGLNEIRVTAEIEVDGVREGDLDDFIDRNVTLRLEKRGNRAFLESKIDNSFFSNRNGVINLTVEVPQPMALDINDGSGSIEIRDIEGDIVLDDGSGSLSIERVRGRVEVEDGSGSIDIDQVEGDLEVDDGSGSLTIRRITGSVEVTDGSGSITIDTVSKDVYIRESGSGGLSIDNVNGKVRKRD
ncbi:MAG: hypothetical protein KDH97_10340 [Calditrichaeota bacterium]|nr:hypothetical protein [Calditrichota bacterium]